MAQETIRDYKDLERKVAALREKGADLSMDEDLSIAVMNLISLEEHMFFTGAKTGKPGYYSLLDEVREVRKALLGKMIPRNEGETWCASKHLLASSMRLIEVGTKLRRDGKTEESEESFRFAYKLWSMFFALRLKLVDLIEAKEMLGKEKPLSIDDIMKSLVDCCKE